MLSGLKKKIGQNRHISGHNIDKNDLFIQRNQNCQENMLHFLSKLSFSIGISQPGLLTLCL